MMKNSSAMLSLVLFNLIATAEASELTIIGSLAYQDKALSFDQEYSGAASNKANFSVHLPMINAGVTLVYGKFFSSLRAEKTLSDTASTTEETNRALELQSNLLTHPGGTIGVERQDMSLTFGYNLWRRMNIFAGYLDGETTLKPNPFCANPFPSDSGEFDPGAPERISCSRSNRAFQQFFIGDNPGQEVPPAYWIEDQQPYEQRYSEDGMFLGISYGFDIQSWGTLSLSAAYAKMDGKYVDNARDSSTNPAFSGTFMPFNFSGDSTGTSLAASWTGSLSESTAYFIDVRRQVYSMDGVDETGNLSGVFLNTEEEMVGISAGVQFYL